MKDYQQQKWTEPLIFEKSKEGHEGYSLDLDTPGSVDIPEELLRKDLNLPQLSEPEIVQHFTRLSQMNYGVDWGIYPLGSCTMKYNPRISEKLASLSNVQSVHPDQPLETIQGSLKLIYRLEGLLSEITGMSDFTLQPSAGAQGEFTAMSIVRKFHETRGDESRKEVIVPDSAHGTNPISGRMAGFEIVEIPSNDRGRVDLEALDYAVSEETAGVMLTNPNTLGLFEDEIEDIVEIVHDRGALLFYDGANLNSIIGKVRPGDMGFDLLHLNLHKTFSTPHGGGGPGSGPVGVKEELKEYLPVPRVEYEDKEDFYYFSEDYPKSIGKIHPYYGNFGVLVKAYVYILLLGPEGLKEVSETAVLNANYIQEKVRKIKGYDLKYGADNHCKHETVLSSEPLKSEMDVRAGDVAKRLLDFGVHAPTIYFPLIVPEALMIEPTETVSKAELDRYCEALKTVSEEAYSDPEKVKSAPHRIASRKLDDTKAARNPILSWKMLTKK